MCRRALIGKQKILKANDVSSTESSFNLGWILLKRGRHAEAESLFRQALNILERHLGWGHADVQITALMLCVALQEQSRCSELEILVRRMAQSSSIAQHPYALAFLRYSVELKQALGTSEDAEDLARQAFERQRNMILDLQSAEFLKYLLRFFFVAKITRGPRSWPLGATTHTLRDLAMIISGLLLA